MLTCSVVLLAVLVDNVSSRLFNRISLPYDESWFPQLGDGVVGDVQLGDFRNADAVEIEDDRRERCRSDDVVPNPRWLLAQIVRCGEFMG